jgi:signal transduction histidine kinase
MESPLLHGRGLRVAALAISLVIAVLPVFRDVSTPAVLLEPHVLAWMGAYLAYAVALWLAFSTSPRWQSRGVKIALLAVQGIAPFLMALIIPCYFGGILHVIVVWQAVLLLRPAQALAWAAAQIALMAVIVFRTCPEESPRGYGWVFLGFEAFAFVTAYATRREMKTRQELARTNAELSVTREILAHGSKIRERERISRDLHDVTGHHLTALSLQLEAASHAPADDKPAHVERAKAITKELLTDVRDVVGALREPDGVDMNRALAMLVERVTDVEVHLDLPPELRVECTARAQALVRCVQEIVTNTLKHACAHHLWVKVSRRGNAIEVEARDDGRGACTFEPGFGLRGMQERFEEIGGRVSAGSDPGGGFRVTALLPLAEASA